MSEINPLDVLFRWIHIGSVIVLVGGTVFARFVLLPAAETLSAETHDALRGRVIGRWKFFVHTLIVLLLVSGFYALIVRVRSTIPLWHALIGVKILLALFLFFIASVLVGRSKGLEKIREQRKTWMAVIVAVAALVVMISGVLRYLPPKAPKPSAAAAVNAEAPGPARTVAPALKGD